MNHRKHRSFHKKRHSKNIINKTINNSLSAVKHTSNKYMPKVKHGLENVGNSVVKTGQQSVPFLQRMTHKFFGMFYGKSKTKRHRRRH